MLVRVIMMMPAMMVHLSCSLTPSHGHNQRTLVNTTRGCIPPPDAETRCRGRSGNHATPVGQAMGAAAPLPHGGPVLQAAVDTSQTRQLNRAADTLAPAVGLGPVEGPAVQVALNPFRPRPLLAWPCAGSRRAVLFSPR